MECPEQGGQYLALKGGGNQPGPQSLEPQNRAWGLRRLPPSCPRPRWGALLLLAEEPSAVPAAWDHAAPMLPPTLASAPFPGHIHTLPTTCHVMLTFSLFNRPVFSASRPLARLLPHRNATTSFSAWKMQDMQFPFLFGCSSRSLQAESQLPSPWSPSDPLRSLSSLQYSTYHTSCN